MTGPLETRQNGGYNCDDGMTYRMMKNSTTSPQTKLILVADDEPDIVTIVEMILRSQGYDVLKAANGLEALELAERHSPDLILLDIMMPDMDGWEVHRRMKADEQLRDIPVIVVTAKDKPIDQVLGLHVAKVEAYLVKADFGPKELLDSVRQVLGEI